jgi:hypothetical protein
MDHLGFRVMVLHCDDLARLGRHLEAQEADCVWSARKLAPGICSTMLRDPEGNLINIFGPLPE